MTTTDDEDFGQLYRRGRPVDISCEPRPVVLDQYVTLGQAIALIVFSSIVFAVALVLGGML